MKPLIKKIRGTRSILICPKCKSNLRLTTLTSRWLCKNCNKMYEDEPV